MPIAQVPSQLAQILARSTYDADWYPGATYEQKVQNAINAAAADGAARVLVHQSYNASLVAFNTTVQMVVEGGDWSTHNIKAYGAAGDGITDDTLAIQAALDAAFAVGNSRVFAPFTQAANGYLFTSFNLPVGIIISGERSKNNQNCWTQFSQIANTALDAITHGNIAARSYGSGIERLNITRIGSPAQIGLKLTRSTFFLTRDVRILGFGTGIQMSSTWDSDFYSTKVYNCDRGLMILADAENSNNLNFFSFHTESFAIGGVYCQGSGAQDNNKIHFYGAKIESVVLGAAGEANVTLSDVRDVAFYGGFGHVGGVSQPAGYPLVRFTGDCQGVVFDGFALSSQAQIGSYLQNVGSNNGIRVFCRITNTNFATTNGYIHISSGTATNWKVDIHTLFDPVLSAVIGGGLLVSSVIEIEGSPAVATRNPTALGLGNNNDWDAGGRAETMRITTNGGGSTLTGISGPWSGKRLRLINVGAGALTLAHQDANSTGANRIISPTGAAVVLNTDDVADLEYDSSVPRWRIVNVLT